MILALNCYWVASTCGARKMQTQGTQETGRVRERKNQEQSYHTNPVGAEWKQMDAMGVYVLVLLLSTHKLASSCQSNRLFFIRTVLQTSNVEFRVVCALCRFLASCLVLFFFSHSFLLSFYSFILFRDELLRRWHFKNSQVETCHWKLIQLKLTGCWELV